MDTAVHNLQTLFRQLGLAFCETAIEQFVNEHSLEAHERINEASFWNPSQTRFLEQALFEDSDWAEIVALFDRLLHSSGSA